MKKALTAFLCLLGTGLISAFGATKLATFNGFANRIAIGDYTVNLNGNTIDDSGNVVINSKPLKLTYSGTAWSGGNSSNTGTSAGITVVVKYSSLPESAESALVTTSTASAGTNSGLGCYATTTAAVSGLNGESTYSDTSTGTIGSSGYLVYVYHWNSVGTAVYYSSDGSTTTTVFSSSGLKGSTAVVGKTICLGGTYENAYVATGLTIEGVAVYQGYFSADEAATAVATYVSDAASDTTLTGLTSVSAINSAIETKEASLDLSSLTTTNRNIFVAADTTITVDASLNYSATIVCPGSVTLSADSADVLADYDISAFDYSGVEGSVYRSWLTDAPTVVGFNFNAANASNTVSALATGTWFHNTSSASGSSTEFFSDGLTKLTWSSANVWSISGGSTMSGSNEFICGYLDDSAGVPITVTAIPYASYDVIIYCATDTADVEFSAKTVNGTTYTWSDTDNATVEGSDTWGSSATTKSTMSAAYGVNALRITNLTGNLTISSVKNGTARGCIAAIQIVSSEAAEPVLTAGAEGETTEVSWTTATWNVGTAPTSGTVSIVLSGDTTLTIDETVSLGAVTVSGTGTLTIAVSDECSFSAASLQYAGSVVLKNAVAIDTLSVTGAVYYDYTTDSLVSSTGGSYYSAGAGSTDSATTVSLVGGSLGLTGGTFYFPSGANMMSATATTVDMSGDTKIDMSAATDVGDGIRFSVGTATYTLSGNAAIETQRFQLSDGGAGRTSVFTMTDNSSVVVTGRTSYTSNDTYYEASAGTIDLNQADVMFGHWNGPSTFTIQDSATFTATNSDVLVGKTANTQIINVNGGTMSVLGFKASAGATGSNTLNISGGTLNLGASGITSHSDSTTIDVNVSGSPTINATDTTMPISQPVALSDSTTTLALKNAKYDEAAATEVDSTTVTFSNTLTGSGTITVGPYVNLVLESAARPDSSTLTLDMSGTTETDTLTVHLVDDIDVVTLAITGGTETADLSSRIIVYDADGNLLSEPSISSASGVYTISKGTKVFNPTAESGDLATASLWTDSDAATEGETFEIRLTTDATLTLDSTVTQYGIVYITNEGEEPLTLTLPANLPATSLILSDNVVLALDGTTTVITNTTPISGTGAVATYGTVTMGCTNTFTGGLTAKTGLLSTTIETGFGGGTAYNACDATITIEDGAAVDLANTTGTGHSYAFVIAGQGNTTDDGGHTGAIFNSGDSIGYGVAQMYQLTLTSNATIVVDSGHDWGLLGAGFRTTPLTLNDYTLTKEGDGIFFLCNTAGTSGTIDVTAGSLQTYRTGSSLAGTTVIEAGATLQADVSLGGDGTVRLAPTETLSVGLSGSGNLSATAVLDTTNIDVEQLTAGQEVTFLSDSNSGLESLTNLSTFTYLTGGRYSATNVTATAVTGTFAATPANFWHYSFDNGTGASTGVASDSTYQADASNWGTSTGSSTTSRNGSALLLNASCTPYWSSNTAGQSPLYTELATITTVLKPAASGYSKNVVWSLGSNYATSNHLSLTVEDDTTLALRCGSGSTSEVVVQVTGIANLTAKYHFVAMKISPSGTTLRVDDTTEESTTVISSADVGQCGQLSTIHGGLASGLSTASTTYLDDWQIYSCLLKDSELDALKKAYLIRPLILSIQ